MQVAKLKFGGDEVVLTDDITTIGRTSDNKISFVQDSNVSRFHAEIERRDGEYWLIDLDSSNGTTVNGDPVTAERRISDGDNIAFGGSSETVFELTEEPLQVADELSDSDNVAGSGSGSAEIGRIGDEVGSLGRQAGSEAEYAASNSIRSAISGGAADPSGASAAASASSTSMGSTVLVAGAVAGLAVVAAVAAGAVYLTRGSACDARITITRPESGDTIIGPAEIEVKTENAGCVQRAIYTLDGEEVASAVAPDFAVTLDPKQFPELADGIDHALGIIAIDGEGNKIQQPGSVMLAFDTRAVTKPPETPGPGNTESPTGPKTGRAELSLVQFNEMAQKLVKQFSGDLRYNVSNKQFLQEVRKRTAEYTTDGYYDRASRYRDTINIAFVREQNIDAPFGFILAMSRSKFDPAKQGDEEGLWRMSSTFVSENKYNGSCAGEPISDQSQNCAARSAALYMKAIIFGVFDGDLIYSAAAFGKSPQDAGTWKATLPVNRTDLWNSIRSPQEREQLIRFFAAGIVAENPQAFGLKNDRPLSELYRGVM